MRAETPSKRVACCLDLCQRQASRLDSETEDAREVRLLDKWDRQGSRLHSETEDAGKVRLLDKRDRQTFRLHSETEDARDVRLLDQRDRHASKIACETEEQASSRQKYQARLYAKRVKSRNVHNFAGSIIATEVPDSIVDEHSSGSMTYSSSVCQAKFWASEKLSSSTKSCYKFSLCCGEGKVVLLPVAPHPALLMHLLTATDPRGERLENRSKHTTTLLHLLLLERTSIRVWLMLSGECTHFVYTE